MENTPPVFHISTERSIRLRITSGGREAGAVSGAFSRVDENEFRLHQFSFTEDAINAELMRRALRELLAALPDASRLTWEYEASQGKEYRTAVSDPHFRLMKSALLSVPGWDVSWRPYGFYYRVDMDALPETIRSKSHYTEARMAADGMTFLPLTAADEYAEQIETLMEADGMARRLEPLATANIDPELSFLSLWHGEVVGWMLLRRMPPDTIDIFRFYAAEKYRARAGGARTAAHMIRMAEGKCRWLAFKIEPWAEGKGRFYARFFGPAMAQDASVYRVEARRTKEKVSNFPPPNHDSPADIRAFQPPSERKRQNSPPVEGRNNPVNCFERAGWFPLP